jgi:hypothetical protein
MVDRWEYTAAATPRATAPIATVFATGCHRLAGFVTTLPPWLLVSPDQSGARATGEVGGSAKQ